jgi:hypothetical protein
LAGGTDPNCICSRVTDRHAERSPCTQPQGCHEIGRGIAPAQYRPFHNDPASALSPRRGIRHEPKVATPKSRTPTLPCSPPPSTKAAAHQFAPTRLPRHSATSSLRHSVTQSLLLFFCSPVLLFIYSDRPLRLCTSALNCIYLAFGIWYLAFPYCLLPPASHLAFLLPSPHVYRRQTRRTRHHSPRSTQARRVIRPLRPQWQPPLHRWPDSHEKWRTHRQRSRRTVSRHGSPRTPHFTRCRHPLRSAVRHQRPCRDQGRDRLA